MSVKPRILVFISFYLPGYKAGGPVKTIVNIVEQLSDEFEFLIVTRDRDLGDIVPYSEIKSHEWIQVGKAKVAYLSPEKLTFRYLAKLINDTDFDVLYLNSFFDVNFTIYPLLARRLGLIKHNPVVLAPRGEFSNAALALKSLKKWLFIKVAKWFGVYRGMVWQASSKFEQNDIISKLDLVSKQVQIAKDLPAKVNPIACKRRALLAAELRLVFLSRISPMKNLDFALRVLSGVTSKLSFDIYGPIEDELYWQTCLELIGNLPPNIKVNYRGAVHPDQVSMVFSDYDVFFFPTRGENYGHVIAESLSVGTVVLISDQTPWIDLSKDYLGWDVPLMDEQRFVQIIEEISLISFEERLALREKVIQNSALKVNNENDIQANKALFRFALNQD